MNLDILKEWIEPVLNEKDCVLYDIEWLTNQNPPILQISVEKQDGTIFLFLYGLRITASRKEGERCGFVFDFQFV